MQTLTSGRSASLYDLSVFVISKILSVTPSGAGPPLDTLYLMPKSAFGPPGLWLAVRRMPPATLRLRMRLLTAGVERMPFWPTMRCLTPLAAAILMIFWMHSGP